MKIYYCDGSQSKELEKLGVGIITETENLYFEYDDFSWGNQTHEIMAITKAIEVAIAEQSKPVIVVNDDGNLIRALDKRLHKTRLNRGLKIEEKYQNLINLMNTHSVQVRPPKNSSERRKIKSAHNMSRAYIGCKNI